MSNEVGMVSIREDLSGEDWRTLSTSPSVTGLKAENVQPVCGRSDKLACFTIDSARNLSLIESCSLDILSSKKLEKALHRLRFSSSVRVSSRSCRWSTVVHALYTIADGSLYQRTERADGSSLFVTRWWSDWRHDARLHCCRSTSVPVRRLRRCSRRRRRLAAMASSDSHLLVDLDSRRRRSWTGAIASSSPVRTPSSCSTYESTVVAGFENSVKRCWTWPCRLNRCCVTRKRRQASLRVLQLWRKPGDGRTGNRHRRPWRQRWVLVCW